MADVKTIAMVIEEVCQEICDKYCKYPNEIDHEDDPDWMMTSPDSPCNDCPLNRLI